MKQSLCLSKYEIEMILNLIEFEKSMISEILECKQSENLSPLEVVNGLLKIQNLESLYEKLVLLISDPANDKPA